eukprot:jgi/Botrbrau1/16829/Bobra.150_2s0053.1
MGRPKRAAARAAEAEAEANKKAKAGLAVGDELPTDLPDLETDETVGKDSKTVNLQDIVKETGVVIFVYPKANTPGCTKQAIGFNNRLDEFTAVGYKVYGLSTDRPKPQSNWKAKQGFKYTLLSDPQSTVISVLGFAKSGKGTHRSHIVIEKGGKVKDIRVGVKPDESVVLALETAQSAPGEPITTGPPAAEEANAANGTEEAPVVPEAEGAAAEVEAAAPAETNAAPAPDATEEVKTDEPAGEAPVAADDKPSEKLRRRRKPWEIPPAAINPEPKEAEKPEPVAEPAAEKESEKVNGLEPAPAAPAEAAQPAPAAPAEAAQPEVVAA